MSEADELLARAEDLERKAKTPREDVNQAAARVVREATEKS